MVEPLTLSLPDVSRFTGISQHHLRLLAKSGQLPHIRVGRLYRFRRETIETWMREEETRNVMVFSGIRRVTI